MHSLAKRENDVAREDAWRAAGFDLRFLLRGKKSAARTVKKRGRNDLYCLRRSKAVEITGVEAEDGNKFLKSTWKFQCLCGMMNALELRR
ncbi:hypothetical protein [Aedoeadaptatus urinae]|uniref:hypothetical protein n=1 Tax=Aedoeadaptatus urinae TaxID=1871017 RepID=UPI00097DEEC7|nr:hypothetical protein [Peptoniphilus urinae]